MKDVSHHSSEYDETSLALLTEDILAMNTDQLEPFVNDLMEIVKKRREIETRQRVTDLVKSIYTSIKTLQAMGYGILIETELSSCYINTNDIGIAVTETKEAR